MSIKSRAAVQILRPYIPGKSKWELERLLRRDDLLRISFNETPLGPSAKALQAIREFLPEIHLYPDGSYQDLRGRLAKAWRRKPENFIIGDGTDEVITMLAQTYVEPDDEVIIGNPTFGAYRLGVAIQGGKLVRINLPAFLYDLSAFNAAITEKTKLLYLCNPNNPTGSYLNKAQLEAFLGQVPSHVLVVIDEAYADYAGAEDFAIASDYLDQYNVIVLRTFSKMYGLAGLRIGYGLAREEIIYDLNRVREPFNVNQLAAVAAEAVLDDTEYVKASRENNSAGKDFFYQQFSKMGLNYVPSEANFIWLEVGVKSEELEAAMLERAITIRGGYAFDCPEWIRLTIGRPVDNERFLAALKELLPRLKRVCASS